MSAALTVGSQPPHPRNHNNPYTTERSTPMNGTLIPPSCTTLYGQTEINPLHPAHLAGRDIGNTCPSIICRLYRAKVEEAIRLIRPLWTVTLDGALYGPRDWQPLTADEAEELHDMIDTIDLDAIITEATR